MVMSDEEKEAAKRQRESAAESARRQAPGPALERQPSSVFKTPPAVGPGRQRRLFTPAKEPQAFETPAQRTARTERVIQPPRTWEQMRPGKGYRGTTQADVRTTLAEQGVTTRGAKARLRATGQAAIERAGGKMPKAMPRGQDFYSDEQADRFREDAKHFNVPYHVAVAVNAIMSPKTSLMTPRGLQTNREAAHTVFNHVLHGRGESPHAGRGLEANAVKAAELVRQHRDYGTHPLDAKDEEGKHLLSGPKVGEYYSAYMHPQHAPTDIQHARVLFGPGVRSEMSEEELAHKKMLDEKYGKGSEESGAYIPKSPAEKLIAKSGVHEWAKKVTADVAQEFGMHPGEFQSMLWHEHKAQRGGRSAVQTEAQPLFVDRRKKKAPKVKQTTLGGSGFRGFKGT